MILIIAFWIEYHNIEDFARALKLTRNDLHNLRLIFVGVEQGDPGILSATGLKVTPHYTWVIKVYLIIIYSKDSELGDMKFFIEKFINTGFLDIKH